METATERGTAVQEAEGVVHTTSEPCSLDLAVTLGHWQELEQASSANNFFTLDEFGISIPLTDDLADQMWVLDGVDGFAGPTLFVVKGSTSWVEDELEDPWGANKIGDWFVQRSAPNDHLNSYTLIKDGVALRVVGVHMDVDHFDSHIESAIALAGGATPEFQGISIRRSGDLTETDYAINRNQGQRTDDAMSVVWMCDADPAPDALLPFDPLISFWLSLRASTPILNAEPIEFEGLPGIYFLKGDDEHVAFIMGGGASDSAVAFMLEDDLGEPNADASDFLAKLAGRYELRQQAVE